MLFIFLAVFLMLCLVFGGIMLMEVARIRELLEMSKPKSEGKKASSKK
jgi:hypothetical protein